MSLANPWRGLVLMAALAALPTPTVYAAALDDRVHKLYASAEYEQALTILKDSTEPEAYLYRALCLVGLGRQGEAQTALQALINAAPDFEVTSEDVPPRVVKLLTETRRQLLPGLVRKTLTSARERYQANQHDQARPLFDKVVAMSSHADIKDIEAIADMRVLAEGFLDLMKTPREVAPVATASAAAPLTTSPTSSQANATTPPIALKQSIPAWPSTLAPLTVPTTGAVRVQINKNGAVTGATIVTRIHPQYDSRVLAIARSWEYTPATLNGVPVESESVVRIRVNPAPAPRARP